MDAPRLHKPCRALHPALLAGLFLALLIYVVLQWYDDRIQRDRYLEIMCVRNCLVRMKMDFARGLLILHTVSPRPPGEGAPAAAARFDQAVEEANACRARFQASVPGKGNHPALAGLRSRLDAVVDSAEHLRRAALACLRNGDEVDPVAVDALVSALGGLERKITGADRQLAAAADATIRSQALLQTAATVAFVASLVGLCCSVSLTNRDRARMLEELAASEECYRALFDYAPDPILVVDPETGDLLDFNEQAYLSLGYTREEFAKLRIADFDVLDSPERVAARVETIMREGGQTFESQHRTKDGRIRDVRINARAVFIAGKRVIHSTCRDLTKQKRMADQLRLQGMIVDNMYEAVLLVRTCDGVIVYANPAAERLYGYPTGGILGLKAGSLRAPVAPAAQARPLNIREEVAQQGVWRGEILCSRKDGETFHSQSSVTAHTHSRYGNTFIVIQTDITERKRAEALARENDRRVMQNDRMITLGIMASGVAHEMNGPNHLIRTHAHALTGFFTGALPILDAYAKQNGDFLIGGVNYAKAREEVGNMLAGIAKGAEHMCAIVEELRLFAKEQPGHRLESVSLPEVVDSAASLLRPMIQAATDHFTLNHGEGIPDVEGNPGQLRQVLVNLVQNACQALEGPEDSITVTTAWQPKDGMAVIRVTDTGKGIPSDTLANITKPFYTSRPDSDRWGLGLFIAARIVSEHGGRLDFTPNSHKGTTAALYLPATLRTEEQELNRG